MNLEQDALQAGLDEVRHATGREDLSVDPELRARIEPLLRVAAAVHRMAWAQPSLSTDRRILAALRVAANREATQAAPAPLWRRPVLALSIACGATLLLGVLSVFAAGDALPSSPLYAIRGMREQVQLLLAAGGADRAHLHATFAIERANQLQALAKQPNRSTHDVTTLLNDINAHTDGATAEVKNAPGAAPEVKQTDAEINQHLEQVQLEADLSPAESEELSATMQSVQRAAAQADLASAPTEPSTPNPTQAPTPEPTAAATPEPTVAATPEPTVAATPVPQSTSEPANQPAP